MGRNILLTGRLVPNSILALITPLAACEVVDCITYVIDNPGPDLPKVTYRCPRRFTKMILGRSLAKLLLLIRCALIQKPDFIFATNLFPHGINAFIAAKLVRTKVGIGIIGSKIAVEGGGYKSDNWLLRLGATPKPWLEYLFLYILRHCDLVTTMGRNTQSYLESKGVEQVTVLPVYVEEKRFFPSIAERDIDAISAAILINRKRVDLFVEAFALVPDKERRKGVVLGIGPLRDILEQMAVKLGVGESIVFAGYSTEFESYLRRTKCFVLLSESEGLSLSMLYAMACGAVPIVRDVGDLIEAAHHRRTAIVLAEPIPHRVAEALMELWSNDDLRNRLSQAAVEYVRDNCSLQTSTQRWRVIFEQRLLQK